MQAQLAAWFDSAFWFWIAAAALWWHVCSATLGAPNALLLRAARGDPEDAALFDRLARRNVAAAAGAWRRGGALAAGIAAFLVVFTAAHAVANRSPAAAGAFCLLAPLSAHLWGGARMALRLDATQPDAAALRAAFLKLRGRAFAAALASVALAGAVRGAARIGALG